MILHRITRSIRRKLMLVVAATTFIALLLSTVGMTIYDIRAYQKSWVEDMTTQAKIIAVASGPAIVFNDPKAARENLNLLRERPAILAATIYTATGAEFAAYTVDPGFARSNAKFPGADGYKIVGDRLLVHHPILENNEPVGTVFLEARYELIERLKSYLTIVGAVLFCSFVVASLIAIKLQASITQPIVEVTDVARKIIDNEDFSLRAEKTTNDEIGVLVDAFNAMLVEVARRTKALEETNRSLAEEMSVRHTAEKKLVDADQRKDEFLATLAHELRNPLAPIRTGLDILRLCGTNAAASQNAIGIMERQIKQMVRLIDDLLDVSRITTGKLSIQKSRVALQPIIQDAIETVRSLVDSLQHTLLVDVPSTPIFLDADALRLAQVFSNLLNNAAKYTTAGGHIIFRVTVHNDEVEIRVIDNGIGISKGMLPRIFEMFAQVDTSLERATAGLGVGLTLAKRFVMLHGGDLTGYSEGLGHGSEFVIRLPIAASDTAAATPVPAVTIDKNALPLRILLSDDNVDFATNFAALLRSLGHEVTVTHSGIQALNSIEYFKPDFAFIDIGLPELNGYELATRLRDLPAMRETVLIAVTGWGQEKDQQRAYAAGFDFHMVKPIRLDDVRELLRRDWRKA